MLPTVRGVIDRRILVNYRVEPDIVADVLPTHSARKPSMDMPSAASA